MGKVNKYQSMFSQGLRLIVGVAGDKRKEGIRNGASFLVLGAEGMESPSTGWGS